MKKNQPTQPPFSAMAKSIADFFSSLFFTNSSKDFERLKNFIAS